MTMTTRKNARANARATTNEYASIDTTPHDVVCDVVMRHDDDNTTMTTTNHDDDVDALTREYGHALTTTTNHDDANITRARIARKLTKRDRAMLRKIARDENANVAHDHNARWHEVVFDVRILQRANIEYKIVE